MTDGVLEDQQTSFAARMPPPGPKVQERVSFQKTAVDQDLPDDILQPHEVSRKEDSIEAIAGPLSKQQAEQGRPGFTQDGAALRNPASPGCVYSGRQLELSPGSCGQAPDDGGGVDSPFHEDMEELREIAEAADQPEPVDEDTRGKLQVVEGRSLSRSPGQALEGQAVYEGDGTPIQTLPPASQIDPSVLDALPLQMKREIERAYGSVLLSQIVLKLDHRS